jgi:hypothetical protein
MGTWVYLLAVSVSFSALASSFPKVDADLKVYDAHVAAMKSAFDRIPSNLNDKDWVTKKLQHMVDVDQYMRLFLNVIYDHQYADDETKDFWAKFFYRGQSVDRANTLDLKELLKIYEWFKISEFGAIADRNAWLLVQHADHDPDFQREVLSLLDRLTKIGETKPANYAYLFDRVAASSNDLSKRTLQTYGTQGLCVSPGIWQPIPIEDPENLDNRRQSVGLGPQANYVAGFKHICK